MADYLTTDTDLTAVADAIRAKTGGSASLAFPAGFISEIGNISGGGNTDLADADMDFVYGEITPAGDTKNLALSMGGISTVYYFLLWLDDFSSYSDLKRIIVKAAYATSANRKTPSAGYSMNAHIVEINASGNTERWQTGVVYTVSGNTLTIGSPSNQATYFRTGVPYRFFVLGT